MKNDGLINCSDLSSVDQFYIDLEYPGFSYSFILNEIYKDYFHVYLTPTEPLNYYEGQNLYIQYNGGDWFKKIIDLNEIPNDIYNNIISTCIIYFLFRLHRKSNSRSRK